MAIPIINVSNLNGSNGFRLDVNSFGYTTGESVSSAGDINGDGFDDVMIGAGYSYGRNDGVSYVVFGKASGFNAVTNLSSLDGNNGFRLGDRSDPLPFLVSDAGDMNGDGFDDVIIGAPGFYDFYDNPRDHPGAGYVVFGRASNFAADISLSNLDGSDGFILDVGESQSVAVSSAGDVNDDGFDDVIVSANITGVVFGKASGFEATFDLSTLDGSNGFRLDGGGGREESVSSAGDINGDGFDDVIVRANGASNASYVVLGKASGFAATLDLSSLDGSNGFLLNGLGNDYYSLKSVSNAGDINGDGFDDVIVGVERAGLNGENSGSSYVVFGRASGFSATMDLFGLDGSNGIRLDGAAYDLSGRSVSSAGDVNGDGLDDVIVGAPGAKASYVIFGMDSGFAPTMDLSSLDGRSGFRVVGNDRNFGSSVSSAGDVNSDGFDDLIIGAPGSISGASYVVFGGDFLNEAIYLGTSGDDIITVDDLNFQLVDGGIGNDTLKMTGGDLNLDLADFHDRIEGIETIDLNGSGDNTLTLSLPDLLGLSDTTDTFTVNGNGGDRVVGLLEGWADGGIEGSYRIFTNSGTSLRVNFAVRTDVPTPGVINLADLNGNNGFRIDGVEDFDSFGQSISEAGDINGDGFDDVIIGAPFANSLNGNPSGASYVIFGKDSSFDASLNLSDLDGSNGFRLDGITFLEHSGRSVSSAGDVNGDGFDDVIIGAPFADPNGISFGSSYVVFGKASGFDATLDLSVLDGNNGFRMDGTVVDDRLGYSVSSAGDVNGDGFDDVIVGAPSADSNGNFSGSSYVVFGKASGFNATLNLSSLNGDDGFRVDGKDVEQFEKPEESGISVSSAGDVNDDGYDDVIVGTFSDSSYVVFGKALGFNASLDLSSLDGSNGFRLDGGNVFSFAYSGKSVSTAGDINGDGFDDVIVGSYRADSNGRFSGVSYVVFGKASGFNTTLDLSKLDGSDGFRIDGAASHDELGISVNNAGDVNGDGFEDVIVGAHYANPIDAGSSYVIFGKASGFSAALSLSNLDSNTGIRLDGIVGGDHSGEAVSGAGDVNGDGFDDLIVGAPDADPNGLDSGSSYVVFGRSNFGDSNVIAGTAGNDKLIGTAAAERFEAGDGNDRMIGRGGADVFHGEAGNDYIQVTDLGFGLVDGGSGNDVLHTDGKDLNLDLGLLGDKIHGIETICLYGRGDNTLTLTGAELKQLSDSTNTLKVHGNAGDRIILEGNWIDGGSHGFYHTYTQDDAVLLVGMNMAAIIG